MVSRLSGLVTVCLVACSSGDAIEGANGDAIGPVLRMANLEPLVSIPFTPSGMAFHERGGLLYVGMDLGYCQADSFSGEVTQAPAEIAEWMPPGTSVVDIGDGEESVLMRSGDYVGVAWATLWLPHLRAVQMGDENVVALRGDDEQCAVTRADLGKNRDPSHVSVPTELCSGDLAVNDRTEDAWVANGDLWLVTHTASVIAPGVGDAVVFEPTQRLAVVSDGEHLIAFDDHGERHWVYKDGDPLVQFVAGGEAGLILAAYSGEVPRLVALDAATGQVMLDMESEPADHLSVSAFGNRAAVHHDGDIYVYAMTWDAPSTP